MASPGRPAPPKPWERQANNSGPSPFAPSSAASSTTAAIATSNSNQGDNKPVAASSNVRTVPVGDGTEGRQMPLRPWERTTAGYANPTTYGAYNRPYGGGVGLGVGGYGYGSGSYNSGASYGGGYGGYGGGYNGYTSPYGGMNYGGGYGSMYSNRYTPGYMPPMAYGAPPGAPGDPQEGPPRPPNFWQSMVSVLHGALNFFGRIAMLVDENTQAFHFFISALLQLCDRAGVLYGELARFVLRLLGYRPRRPKTRGAPLAVQQKVEPEGGWDNVWGAPAAAVAE